MSWIYSAGALLALGYYGIRKLQSFLIYPSSFPEDARTEVDNPGSFGLEFEELWLPTPDGQTLHAFFIPKQGARTTVVMFGPNAGNIGHSLPLARLFNKEIGVNVLTVSYRGYGLSTGSASEKGLKRDAETVGEYIRNSSRLSSTQIVLYGRSLGGAETIYLAAHAKPLIRGIIVENTFLSIVKLIPSVLPIAYYIRFLVTERWQSEKTILEMDPACAALFLAGEKDELVPPLHFKQLYDLCPATHKQYISYPNGFHNDTCTQPGYWRDVHYFINQIEAAETAPPPS